MDLQAVRTELATLAIGGLWDDALWDGYDFGTGWTVYDFMPGSANLPAVVIGLPETVAAQSSGLWRVRLPVIVMTRSADPSAADTAIQRAAVGVTRLYRANPTGTAYRSCRVAEIADFFEITVGNAEASTATVWLELTTPAP